MVWFAAMICWNYELNSIQLQKQLPSHVPATQKNSTVVNQLIVIEKPNKAQITLALNTLKKKKNLNEI